MKTINRIIICLLMVAPVCAAQTEPQVNWFDDFLGVALHPGYAISLAGTGVVRISDAPSVGGVVLLGVMGTAPGAARLRLGEDPVTGAQNALNFSAKKNLVYRTRVFLNRNTDLQATIGFVGYHDPENVLALVIGAKEGGPNWEFQVVNGGKGVQTPTGFLHEPGRWFTVKIVTEWGEVPSVRLYINDSAEPLVTVKGQSVPGDGLCPEFQVWNKKLDSGYSQPSLYIDYLSVTQDR
jgi:hypothetical protein